MSSTVKYKPYTSTIREMVQIPTSLNSIIVGILLSDGWAYKPRQNINNSYLSFKQSLNKFEYVWFIFLNLSHYCAGYPRITSTKVKDKNFNGIVVTTRVYPCFTKWYNKFYINNKKIIPDDFYDILNYEVLAHWIMGHGTKSGKALVLPTQSFTVKEVVFIISVLIYKFNLNCSLHLQRNQPTIFISTRSMIELKPKIIPFFIPSMKYKIE